MAKKKKRKGRKKKAPRGAITRLKWITAEAKRLRKKKPSRSWSGVMKEAGRKYKKKH